MSLSNTKDNWSSKYAFILATTGAAVGLGNIWKFPYMVGDGGGSAFVFIYLIAVVLIGIPVLMAEFSLGKRSCHNPVDTYIELAHDAGASAKWQAVGWLGALCLILVMSFYCVVGSWSLTYCAKIFQYDFQQLTDKAVHGVWLDFLSHPYEMLMYNFVFLILTSGVVILGVRNGIERASKVLMPMLFVVLAGLVVYASSFDGFGKALHFMFAFDMSKINIHVAMNALGHAFFTLAVGAGCMLTYSAYLPKHVTIGYVAFTITGLNLLVALMAGLAIFPLVFSYDFLPTGGPGLMFEVLPLIFGKIYGGAYIGVLFFLLLFFAAWTSAISLIEPVIAIVVQKTKLSRVQAVILLSILIGLLTIPNVLSFNAIADMQFFSRNVFGVITDLSTNILLPLGGLGIALFSGYVVSKSTHQAALTLHNAIHMKLWWGLIRYVAPIGILAIMFYDSLT